MVHCGLATMCNCHVAMVTASDSGIKELVYLNEETQMGTIACQLSDNYRILVFNTIWYLYLSRSPFAFAYALRTPYGGKQKGDFTFGFLASYLRFKMHRRRARDLPSVPLCPFYPYAPSVRPPKAKGMHGHRRSPL